MRPTREQTQRVVHGRDGHEDRRTMRPGQLHQPLGLAADPMDAGGVAPGALQGLANDFGGQWVPGRELDVSRDQLPEVPQWLIDAIAKQGNFKTLIEPWKEFQSWVNEVWVVRADWLNKPENERALVDFLKAQLLAFRKANSDFDVLLKLQGIHRAPHR